MVHVSIRLYRGGDHPFEENWAEPRPSVTSLRVYIAHHHCTPAAAAASSHAGELAA